MIDLLTGIFGWPALVALAAALVLTWLGRRIAPSDHRCSFVLPVAVALAYFVGYAALPRSFAALVPQANQAWQWLPYLGLIAAAIAVIFQALPRFGAWRLAVMAVASLVAMTLAPTWPIYGFSGWSVIGAITVYLLVDGIPLQHLPPRVLNLAFLGILTAAATLLAVAAGAMVSVRLAQLAAIGAGALGGSAIACALGPEPTELSVRSLVPVFVALVGGAAVVVALEPDPPQLGLLAIPLLPLATCLIVAIPVREGR